VSCFVAEGKITCPMLNFAGEGEGPLMNGLGHDFYEKLTCPKTERLVRLIEGGEAHCQMNNLSLKLRWATLKKILEHEEPPGYRRSRLPRRPTVEPVLPIIRDRGAQRVRMLRCVGPVERNE
jgi:hypothetical protein